VREFLAANAGFHIVPAEEVLKRQGIAIPGSGEFLRLYPHVHDTDGFFAAVMERDK
jgi:tRNA and rRNA cytosine-C5-methylases